MVAFIIGPLGIIVELITKICSDENTVYSKSISNILKPFH